MYIGIDLALRKTGIVCIDKDNKIKKFGLIVSSSSEYNNEDLLLRNNSEIKKFLLSCDCKINRIGLEGLAFGGLSPAIDLIDANHWMTRIEIKNSNIECIIIPPKSWQKFILTKDILSIYASKNPIVRAKKGLKLTKEEIQSNTKNKAATKKEAKEYIYNSIPIEIREQFEKYIEKNKLPKDGKYDLSDAYHLAIFARNKDGK